MKRRLEISITLPPLVQELAKIDRDTLFETYLENGVLKINTYSAAEEDLKKIFVTTEGCYDVNFRID